MKKRKFTIHIGNDALDGHDYSLERGVFEEMFCELVGEKIEADYPGAEVEFISVNASGATPRDYATAPEGWCDEDLTGYYLPEVTGEAWQRAHEALGGDRGNHQS